jgi:protoporphyrinogen oxidase
MKICIIGAGPTGLGAAHRLTEMGFADFRVFERNTYVGGLSASFYDREGYTWDFGVHVAHSHYAYFDRLLDSLLPDGFFYHKRLSWIRENGSYVPYPFQYNIRHLPRETMWECIQGLLDLQAREVLGPPRNFEEWIVAKFGEGIARHFMFPYNRKMWNIELSQMGYEWTGDRVAPTDIRRVLKNVILMRDDISWGCNNIFQFPKTGGTGAIWQAMARRLPEGTLFLDHELVGVDTRAKELRFAHGASEKYDVLISTMPVTDLVRIAGLENLEARARQLRHTSVHVLGVAAPCRLPAELESKTWLYCPAVEVPFYRLTPFSAFSPAHVPDPAHGSSVLCESSATAGETVSEECLVGQTLESLRNGHFLNVSADSAHVWSMSAAHGYPIPTRERDRILADVAPALESLGIYSRGRFGAWKYEVGNMDHSVMQGVEVVDRIVNGKAEQTLPDPAEVNSRKQ